MYILTSISLLLLEADLLLTSKAFPDSNFMELTGIIKILNSNFVDLLFVTIVDAATLHLEWTPYFDFVTPINYFREIRS